MASVNKVILDTERLKRLYLEDELSIPAVGRLLGVSRSTVRLRLLECGVVLRSRADGIRLAGDKGKLGGGMRGKRRVFTEQWRANLSASSIQRADATAAGVSHKTGGYTQITRGPHKGRGLHVVIKEAEIGRRILPTEVVHHDDEDKQNNAPENLVLMSRADHTRLHRQHQKSQRNPHGQR